MDRNLSIRLQQLSKQLTDYVSELEHLKITDESDEDERERLEATIADIQDEIWDIEDTLEGDAADEYAEHSAKGWN